METGINYCQNGRLEKAKPGSQYCRPLFNCEILINANCEVSHNSQLLETQ